MGMHRVDEHVNIKVSEPSHDRRGWVPRVFARTAVGHVVVVLCLVAFVAGDLLRGWVWEQTANIRYVGDVNNGFRWDIVGPAGTLTLPLSAVGLTDRPVTMRALLIALYGMTLVLCGAVAAWHWRPPKPAAAGRAVRAVGAELRAAAADEQPLPLLGRCAVWDDRRQRCRRAAAGVVPVAGVLRDDGGSDVPLLTGLPSRTGVRRVADVSGPVVRGSSGGGGDVVHGTGTHQSR
jgi:hypothetical protein